MSIWYLFLVTKLLILSIVCLCPAPYDTSTLLLLDSVEADKPLVWRAIAHVVQRLAIWDNVFYTTMAQRGSLYEHEWAFGRLLWYTFRLASKYFVSPCLKLLGSPLPDLYNYAIAGVMLSNVSHLVATYMLYFLTKRIFPKNGKRFALLAAYSHILTPAGIFLMAGYGESTFALLTFAGLYLRELNWYIPAGLCFALSTGIRGNGIFWGVVFAADLLYYLFQSFRKRKFPFRLIGSIIAGGAILGSAFIYIQWSAYTTFCTDNQTELRPWCEQQPPLIFTFVQKHYWNVGYLEYWTPNNIPNFGFATPTLTIMALSAVWALKLMIRGPVAQKARQSPRDVPSVSLTLFPCVIVQLILLFGSLLMWHVQIVTRIASCLPIINWYLAYLFTSAKLQDIRLGKAIVSYTVMWICAQAALFACYLPPA